jgi:amino acid adenylation domain-containing protein
MSHDVSVSAERATERAWLELSLAQQSVWLDAKLSGASAYQLGGWARVAAPLDEAAVRQSVRLLMARHDALRLRVDDELPRQWLDESTEPPITICNLSGRGDPDAAFRAHVDRAFAEPMPLGDRPLFQIELLHAGEDLHYVLWRFHHLIADSTSVSITLSHWFEAYDALTSSTPGELAPPSSYLKLIAADAAYLESAGYHQHLAYWAARFEPLPPPLIADLSAIPADREAPASVPTASWVLDGEAYAAFERAAETAGTTAQRALFALFALALGRRYGQTDIVSGVALHRRDLANRHTLGMMAGVIAVRCDFDPFWTLAECVQAFSEQVDADLRHQRLPVDVLARALGLSGTGRTGLFEVAMSYMPAVRGQGESPLAGLPVTTGVVATREASPISLHVAELASEGSGGGLSVQVAVNTDFLDAAEAATLGELLRAALDRFVREPEACFDDLDRVTDAERALVVERWNDTDAAFAQGTLDGLFRAQAAATPGAIAVVGSDGAELTYAELDARSTHLARQLVAGGVQAGRVVGVRMVRSAETVIALLAILKAGGAYLPLDPAYPAERLAYMAADADAMLVLDSIDLVEGSTRELELPELPVVSDAGRPAYVIYTSGTTGLPKGVAVTHASAVNLAFARRACHDPLGVGDRVLAAISVGFDVSIGQLLLPLLSGATVVIAGEVRTMDAGEFWGLLARRGVTHINSVPSFFESILEAAPELGALRLKRLMLGGEALAGALVERIHQALPGLEVVNMYGPTEATIDATFHVATAAEYGLAVLPIGRPLSNYRAYVLDGEQAPVGIGVTGELYLGGAGLARGYVNAPELTAERFVEDTFSSTSGARLYRTGDRARFRADGAIEFLGRGDAQVKIRGFRVEPGEIAAALLGHEAVAQAVVVPRAASPEKPQLRLVAYIVPRAGATVPEAAALRAFLAETLPEYMVPSAFVAVAAMPLNRNGKLDVGALPSPDVEAGEYIAPRTPTEAAVAALFAEVLGLEHCGATDHFFELGGHSLLATSLVSKLRTQGWTVPLRAIFETPTVEMLARRIDASLPPAEADGRIIDGERPDEIPLSFSQERIWFVDRLQQDSSYNIPVAFALRGELNVSAVELAIERIVARHEALRTRIVMTGGRPVQQILEATPLPLGRLDLSGLAPDAREGALREALAELNRQRFDLAAVPPIAMLLVTLAPEHHVLAAVVHHVAFDGWSAGVFLREFAAIYTALVAGEPDALAPLAVQYADFALWQRRQDRVGDLRFWLEELEGAPAELELPGCELAGDEGSRLSGTLAFRLSPALYSGLLRLASEQGASLFMLLHAAFALLLARVSGQEDVVVGTVVANRNRSDFEPLIGCFVNTLPLRTRFAPGESFRSLLGRVKSADLAAFAHQDLAFEQLVEALHPERSLEHTPIFQVLLVLQNAPTPAAALPGLELEPILIEAEAAKFDLTLSLAEEAGTLGGTFEFARNRFSEEAIQTLAARFERLLTMVVAEPQREALSIEVLDAAERGLVVDEWNRTEMSFRSGTLDGLFREQAGRTPEAIAVVGVDGRELSYAELDARSSLLAQQLMGGGVQPGQVVGVRLPRSAETVVALLGILKAGAVYLPLDPAYPADRLEYMVADAGAVLVLDSLDALDADAGGDRGTLPGLDDADRPAYVIYTSGTTGLPKGVAMTHRAAVNLAYARRAAHDPLGVGDRVLAAISVGFDVSIGQLLLPLLSGATVVIAGEVKTMGAGEFWALVAEQRVTHINSVPSFLESMLDGAPRPGTLSLARLMLGGEALSGALVARIGRALPGVDIVNMYGPTEACIDATYHVATAADHALAVLPIGRPLPNYRAYVLDRRMQPVGIGVAGELYLGGAGLAEGYVNAPALTAERFVPDPFAEPAAAGGRLYRTGDRVRFRADGAIEFLGRADNQVKIRGFRVEPGEIEAQLRLHPGVREAAVVAQVAEGGTRLIAYYVGEQARIEAMRASLAAVLPDYMIPAAFVRLEQLPLSLNGKLDRRALPAPEQEAFVARVYEAPIGVTEQALAALWAELLKLDRVGRHDNFFELGGHSLLAVSLIERMREQGLPGDVRALFTTPTIAGLAGARVSTVAQVEAPANGILPGCDRITPEMLPLVSLTQAQIDGIVANLPGAAGAAGGAANVQDIYPLSPLQEGILFQHRITAEGDPYLTPFLLGFKTRGLVDSFVEALARLVDRHDVLRTAMVWEGVDAPVQVVLRQVGLPVDEVMISGPDAATELLGRFDPRSYRLDLSQAPLLKVVIARDEASGRWLLLLLTHHLVLDHTSLEILIDELRTLMANPQAVLPAALPYRNFIAQTRVGIGDGEAHEAFFARLLGDVEEPTAPFGLLDTQASAGVTDESRLELAPELARGIRARARALGVTPASLFHLGWAAVLGHVSGKTDVVFGTVLFGRMRSAAGADRVVGMFINTLPMRVRLGDGGVAARVIETHQLLAELMAHEHAPLALAQRASAVPPPAPLFSSLFNYRYSAGSEAAGGWPGVEMVHAAERTNYPLSMAVDDTGTGFALTALAPAGAGAGPAGANAGQVCRYLEQALNELVLLLDRASSTPVRVLEVLPPEERVLPVTRWNATGAAFPTGTLDGLFGLQAQETPTAVAVVGVDGREVSYVELDRRSTRLARQLAARGVADGQVVGVRMERCAETVVALLAILKAGAVYLPLDPAYPAERLDYMAADAGAVLVLDSLAGFEEDLRADAELPELAASADLERLAYVIYTSGTTGLPKGVAVAHGAAVNLAYARRAAHDPLDAGDRVLAAISVGFDVSIGQLLLPLLSGATVVVAGEIKTMGAGEFWALLAERRVTHINSVPSFVDSMLDAAPAAGTLALKRLMLGGEALAGSLVERIHRAIPAVEVVNMYGPTEACIDATFHVATEADYPAAVVPIGLPLPNYRAYVLNSRMQPVGVGVTGELYLGGAGLARGYVNAPALTAERFVADPFVPGARLYRTGDLARRRADGALEFLGRADAQVKIRGFRVEPGEVEAQLRRQPGVRDAAVVAHSGEGGTRLVAYYTGESAPAIEDLRAALTAALPDYMVPAAFVQLAQLPLSANGKLDRKALPVPGLEAFVARAYEAPQGEVEEKMAALWVALLKLERVGRHDDFFELGGHSLLAVTLIEKMRQQGLPGDVRALFTTPTIAGLASASMDVQASAPENRIAAGAEAITPEMLPLVSLTQAEIDRIVNRVPGGAANVQDIYPLSPLQEGILFQHLVTGEDDPYLSPLLLGFTERGQLDLFLQALGLLVERHDVLRTAMVWRDVEEPVQVVLRHARLPLDEIEIDAGAPDELDPDAGRQLLARFDPRTFRMDLSRAPLLRAVVAQDHERGRWLLLLLTHHLILDHTSLEILVHELRTLVANPQAVLPATIPYRNFIAQTRQPVLGESHEAFFRRLLGDVDEPTAPYGLIEIQAGAGGSSEGRRTLDAVLAGQIRVQARSLGVTPASLFHLAWGAVLGHLAGKPDVVFGTVLFGRMRSAAGADQVVGMFINTLPMRLKIDATGAAESARQTHRLLAELMAHEHAPLVLAQRTSAVGPTVPLFSSLFNYRYNAGSDGAPEWAGVEMLQATERTNYPVSMAVEDSAAGFEVIALGQRGADPDQVCRYLEQALAGLVRVLEHAPETPIETLEVVPADERVLLTEEWNQTQAEFPAGMLDALFEAQARATPMAIALVGLDRKQMTYAELDRQTTLLARQLLSRVTTPDAVIGVRMGRSAETTIALLAVLKAGAVYLPLDPDYPAERLAYMAEDAGAALVLDSLDGFDLSEAAPGAGLPPLPVHTDSERIAYVIYTSGTTGHPKGVAVPHRAAVNLAFARRAYDPIGVGDRVLAVSSVGFDVSVGQLLLPLLSGATVVVAGDLKAMGAAEFWALMAEQRITHINSVPSVIDALIDAAPPVETLRFKQLMMGGEALSGALVGRIQRALPGVKIVNMYGPTEACIDATFHVATEADLAAATLPIGRPLPNYRAYVLDAGMRPVGVGVAGELYLGGPGVARGYINSPELTAERFVPDTFSQESGSRLYRTGDRARRRADGAIEFLGRVDNQVKIRGFRVEPGEIEAQLRLQPGVREAAVLAQTSDGSTRLIAYYTVAAESDAGVSAEGLRAALAATLPDYMVPSAFIELTALPLSLNGKLDRKALPLPARQALAARAYEAPMGETEEAVSAHWAAVLRLERVGRHENFFELGGDSLCAMRLMNVLNTAFGLRMPIRALFQHPTVEALAAEILGGAKGNRSPNLVPLQSGGAKPPLYFVHPSSGHVFRYLPLARALGADQPVYGLQASGLEDGEVSTGSIEEIAASYVDAILSEQPQGPYHLLGYSSGGLLTFEMAHQLRARGEEVAFVALLDTTLPDPLLGKTATNKMVVLDMAS